MGFFGLFKSKDESGGGSRDGKKNPASKWAEAAGSKRAQNYDRQEALQELANLGTSEAVEALLKRFTFVMDPSITDQEEKDLAFQGIVRAGREAVEPVRAFAAKAESLGWPMKVLKEVLHDDEFVEELLIWLKRWDTEYSKFIDPKLQILVALEEYKHADIRAAVEPFLEDVNDEARYHAVCTTLAQDDEGIVPALVAVMLDEESVRIKNKIADGLISHKWPVPEDSRDAFRKALTPGYTVNASGLVQKR